MNEPMIEDKQRTRRRLVDQAITLAMEAKWAEAVEVNRRIVYELEADTEAWNRLGKAYAQLGRIHEARQAYHEALRLDPTNTIAKRNLERLSVLSDKIVEPEPEQPHRIGQQFFIEETGKTTTRSIFSDAPLELIARVAPGDRVELRASGDVLVVHTYAGERLGALEGRLSRRLLDLMAGGNQYAAAVVGVEKRQVRLLIRETFQAPGMLGRVSFPPEGSASGPRPYIKDSALRYDDDDDAGDLDSGDTEQDDITDEPDFGEDLEA